MTTTPTKRGRPLLDLTGQRFGKWTVIERAGSSVYANARRGQPLWRCRCDCGTEAVIQGVSLRCGASTGCLVCYRAMLATVIPLRHAAWRASVKLRAVLLREAAAALPPGELRHRIVAALGTEGE